MNDETTAGLMKRTREWLQSCVNAATRSGVPEEADLEAFILAHIDGEPARLAAARTEGAEQAWDEAVKTTELEQAHVRLRAVAAAREEQREADARYCPNCLGVGFVERPVPCPYCDDSTHDHYCPTGTQRQQCGCGAERIRTTPLTATPLADEIAALRARVAELEADQHCPTCGSSVYTYVDCDVTPLRARVAELEAQAERLAKMYARALGRESEAARAEQDEAAKK